MISGFVYLLVLIGLVAFMNYFLRLRNHHIDQVVVTIRVMIILLYWVFYQPFFESFISIIKCNPDGTHYIDNSLVCYQGIHIFVVVLCIIFLVLLFGINVVIAMLYNETQPSTDDCFSRMETNFELVYIVYRSLVAAFGGFCSSDTCSWILIVVFLVVSGFQCIQYTKHVPYYNFYMSVFMGSIFVTYFWIALNALLMKFLKVDGHIIIIFAGIPLIVLLVKKVREYTLERLMKLSIDGIKTDLDALIQVQKMSDFANGTYICQQDRVIMIGVINLHITECQNIECPCKETYELFDIKRNDFCVRNYQQLHQDQVFLSHYIKKLYEDALNKFSTSSVIHIDFAFYLFKEMVNITQSLLELNNAQKKKPSLQQQFTIFRYKNIIEEYIQQDHRDHKEVYPQLTNVIEFERLFNEMQKAIETVSNLQVEFWTHLTTLVPDLNVLNEIGIKIYGASEEVDRLWVVLCQINSNYQHAQTLYGEYLKVIRNNEHLGTILIEKGLTNQAVKKAIDEHAQNSDVLFNDDTTILHMSGNKESIGKILNASQGLSKVFGYSKNEVVGHSINILMPPIFARLHTEFLERFFRTGRQIIFYQERDLFATHRNGNCFSVRILVKQFPNLIEGIQYVGMLKPIISDFEYIITNMDGVIDSFTKGITGLLGISPNMFKDKDSQVNIQILAPDLISFFQDMISRGGRLGKSKFREPGGEHLTMIVPQDFSSIAKQEGKLGVKRSTKGKSHKSQGAQNRSLIFRQFLMALSKTGGGRRAFSQSSKMPTAQQITASPEYVKCERKRAVQCEIVFHEFKANLTESTKLLVFKLSRNLMDKDHQFQEGADMLGMAGAAMIGLIQDAHNVTPIKNTVYQNAVINQLDTNSSEEPVKRGMTAESRKKIPERNRSGVVGGSNDSTQKLATSKKFNSGSSNQVVNQKVASGRSINISYSNDKKSSNQEFNASQVDEEDDEEEQDIKTQKSVSPAFPKPKNMPILEQEEDNEDDIETPRVNMMAFKLDPNQQKEKISFFDELRKQSFMMSGNSTNKVSLQDNLNVTDQQKQEKISFEKQNKELFGVELSKQQVSSSERGRMSPSQQAKKQQNNIILGRLLGDDEEPQDFIGRVDGESQSIINEDSQEEEEEEESDSMMSQVNTDEAFNSSSVSSAKPLTAIIIKDLSSGQAFSSKSKDNSQMQRSKIKGTNPANRSNRDSNQVKTQFQGPSIQNFGDNMNNLAVPNQSTKSKIIKSELTLADEEEQRKNRISKQENSYSKEDEEENKHLLKKRDTNKIKTNPKYRCDDDGSDNDDDHIKHEDYQQLCSQEIDFRETIIKMEKKRIKKERKMKERELKKQKAINGGDTPTDGAAPTTNPDGDDDDDEEDQTSDTPSVSESSDDSSDDGVKQGVAQKNKNLKKSKRDNDQGDVSSLSTRKTKTERNHYILRSAIDEKFVPNSVVNLRYAAYLVFFILALLAIVFYVVQLSLYSTTSQNLTNIRKSEDRLNSIIDIALRTRTLTIISSNYIDNSTLNATIGFLQDSATQLKQAQTVLSQQTASLSSDVLNQINPHILLQFKTYPNMPNQYTLSMWEAIMEVLVSAFRISSLALSSIQDNQSSVFFVINNCLNSVLIGSANSTEAIIQQVSSVRQQNVAVFLYLLIIASCTLVISLIILVPIIDKVTKSKQEVLELFTNRSIDKHIDDQLKVCRNFISLRLQQNNDAAGAAENNQEIDQGANGQQQAGDKELQNEINGNAKILRHNKRKSKNKKWKHLNNDFGYILLKFLLFIAIIEGYFLQSYLVSKQFISEVAQLRQELKLLISRQPTQSFLLLSQYELIYSNGTAVIQGQIAEGYVPSYLETVYNDQEELLDMFSSNFNFHSTAYNNMFNGIFYQDLCQQVSYDDNGTCELFSQGILSKGIYSAVINYWDYLRQLSHDFIQSPRTNATLNATIIKFLNDPRLKVAQQMQDFYFKKALQQLGDLFIGEIILFFTNNEVQSRTIFIIYLFYIVLLYYFVWLKFIDQLKNDLWKTKSMLGILPTKVCFDIEDIRQFIYSNSSNESTISKT